MWSNRSLRVALLLKATQLKFWAGHLLLVNILDAIISCQIHPGVLECSSFFVAFLAAQSGSFQGCWLTFQDLGVDG